MEIKDIHILIGIGIIVLTAAATVLGTIKFAIPNLKDSLGKLSRRLCRLEEQMPATITKAEFEKEIKRLDGNCTTHRAACQALLCGRIDEVRGDLRGMDNKREKARFHTVERTDFEAYKKEMKEHVKSIEAKIDSHSGLLNRLDERMLILLKSNGHKP